MRNKREIDEREMGEREMGLHKGDVHALSIHALSLGNTVGPRCEQQQRFAQKQRLRGIIITVVGTLTVTPDALLLRMLQAHIITLCIATTVNIFIPLYIVVHCHNGEHCRY